MALHETCHLSDWGWGVEEPMSVGEKPQGGERVMLMPRPINNLFITAYSHYYMLRHYVHTDRHISMQLITNTYMHA